MRGHMHDMVEMLIRSLYLLSSELTGQTKADDPVMKALHLTAAWRLNIHGHTVIISFWAGKWHGKSKVLTGSAPSLIILEFHGYMSYKMALSIIHSQIVGFETDTARIIDDIKLYSLPRDLASEDGLKQPESI